jgi:Fe-S-cluster-containing dehydrogenase component/DMSO reductase anchor subunit
VFNHRLCVNCKACSAACMLYNDWNFTARRIFTHNAETFNPGPVINISMACNHCDDPACLLGCPTGAFIMDEVTAAIVIDPDRCIGCRYCIWNCPYDAPRFNDEKGIIEKCHFCNSLLKEGYEPACSSACPTGALGFGEIPEKISFKDSALIPDKDINPSFHFSGGITQNIPEIIPAIAEKKNSGRFSEDKSNDNKDYSLIAFTFLSSLSVALAVADNFSATTAGDIYPVIAMLLAVLSSFFHLSSRVNAWKSVFNIVTSPLSREIISLIIYGGLLLAGQFMDSPLIRILASVAGLILLLLIDAVYTYSLGKMNRFHSGQTFITSLLIISFISQQTMPFLFIALLKLVIIFASGRLTRTDRTLFGIRFIRVAVLLISMMIIVSGTGAEELTSVIVFLTGEFIDRYLFYTDFEPLNIIRTINNPLNTYSDEKEDN